MNRSNLSAERELASVMRRNPVIVDRAATLDEAFALLESYGIRHLPVVERNRLRGLFSDRDLGFWRGLTSAEQRLRVARGEEPRAPRRVSELLEKPLHCLSPRDSVLQAVEDMVRLGIGAIPIVERVGAEDELVGIVTETDFLRAFLERCRQTPNGDAPARTRMHTPVPHVAPEASIDEALVLLDRSLLHLAVVRGGELVGILSERDLLLGLARDAFRTARAEAGEPRAATRVADVMSAPPVTAEPDEPLSHCAGRMLDHKLSALPLLQRGVLLGLVTQRDVLAHFAAVLAAEGVATGRAARGKRSGAT